MQGCHCRMTCTFFSYCLPNTSNKWPLPSELVSSFCEFAISDRQSIRPAIWGGKENFDAKELWITTLERVKYKGEKGQIWDVFVKTFHIIDPINPIICPQQAIERKSVTSRYHGSKFLDHNRSLINADGNSNENGKKARNLYLQNNNFARGAHFFVHFSVVVALPRHVKKEYVNTTQQFPFSF